MNMIKTFVQQSIKSHPEAAEREVPQILDYYITDNSRLNAVFVAAERVLIQPDKFSLGLLAKAIAKAKQPLTLWDEKP